MRFMTIYRPADIQGMESGAPPTDDESVRMGQFIQELAAEGVLLLTDGLLPTSRGAIVRQDKGKVTVTDGPFTEAREIIGGFAIVQVESKAQAIDLAKRFLEVAGDGESEIREMYDAPAFEAANH